MPLVSLSSLAASSWDRTASYDWEDKCGVRTCLKCVDGVLHVINAGLIFPALLICAAVALSYINKVGDYVDDHGGQLVITETVEVENDRYYIRDYTTVTKDYGEFDASSSRGAAGWTLFVSCVGLIFHTVVFTIVFRCDGFDPEKHNTHYSVTVVVFSCLSILSCLAGGIANIVFYSDNNKLWSDACSHYDYFSGPKVCRHLLTVCNTEIACAVIAFVAVQIYLLITVIVIWSGVLINRKRGQELTVETQPSALSSTSPPAHAKTEAPPEKPSSVPPDSSHCHLSVPPPPYEANPRDEPPSYQSVIANS